jgi:hypothetical protein
MPLEVGGQGVALHGGAEGGPLFHDPGPALLGRGEAERLFTLDRKRAELRRDGVLVRLPSGY